MNPVSTPIAATVANYGTISAPSLSGTAILANTLILTNYASGVISGDGGAVSGSQTPTLTITNFGAISGGIDAAFRRYFRQRRQCHEFRRHIGCDRQRRPRDCRWRAAPSPITPAALSPAISTPSRPTAIPRYSTPGTISTANGGPRFSFSRCGVCIWRQYADHRADQRHQRQRGRHRHRHVPARRHRQRHVRPQHDRSGPAVSRLRHVQRDRRDMDGDKYLRSEQSLDRAERYACW